MREKGPAIDIWKESRDGGIRIETIDIPNTNRNRVNGFIEALAQIVGGNVHYEEPVTLMVDHPTHHLRYENAQIIVDEKDLPNHLSHGYRFVATLPSGKVLVEKVVNSSKQV
jgi:hypothetical protein